MANRYTRALKQIKDATLDEKLKLLEGLPTNNTTGLYTDVPGFPAPETTVPGDIDSPLNLEQDGDGEEGYTGNDTTGLFETDGTIRAVEPPGDTSYVLGPMMSMYYGWGGFSQIGYVRQSDRKMVNLARITGTVENWDGESGFTSYGQLTLEQAVWYRDQSRQDYRAFYPGPPSNPADEYGRYIGSIVAESKPTEITIPENPNKRYVDGTNRPADPSDNFSLAMDRGGAAVGIGIVIWMGIEGGKVIKNIIDSLTPEEKERLFDNATSQFGDTDAAGKFAETNIGYEMASARGPYGTPGADKPYVRRGYKDKEGKFVDFDNPATWPSIVPKLPRARGTTTNPYGGNTVAASYKPRGRFISEQATGGGTITAHTDAGDVTITIPPRPPLPPKSDTGSGMQTTPQEGLPTDFSKSTLQYLRGQKSEYFVAGYIKGTAAGTNGAAELEKMFVGTTVSWYQVVGMVDEMNRIDKAKTEANERYMETWDIIHPQITDLINQMRSVPATESAFYSTYLPLSNRVDALYAQHDRIFDECIRLSQQSLDASKRLGLYVKSGKLVDVDPFKLNDPTIKKEKELDEAEINKLIAELKKAASDAQRAALLNKLKAFGYGALLAAGAVIGFKILLGGAGLKALGAPLVNMLKKLAPKVTKTPVSKPPVPKPSGKPFQNASDDFIRAIRDPKNLTRANDVVSRAPKGFKNDVGIQINIGGKTQTVNAADILRYQGFQIQSYQPSGKLLTESQKRALRNVKKPVQVKEIPTKVKVKPTSRKNKTIGADMMKTPKVPEAFKPEPQIWNSSDKKKNQVASQEKKNQVLELVGAAEHHWTHLTEDSRKKKQEKVNEMMSAEYDKQMESMYEKYVSKQNKLDKTVSALKQKKKYLSDSDTSVAKKKTFTKWYDSVDATTADKIISDAKIETKDQIMELVVAEFNRLRLQEGMSSKGFEYIYGLAVNNIVSQYRIDSKFASDLLHSSADATDYEYGPGYPGSHINSIGDYQVDSSRLVNVNAYYDSTFGSVSGAGGSFTLNTIDGPGAASRASLESALGISLPTGIPNDSLTGTPTEGSAVQRTFTGAKPGNIINFTWGFSSTEKGLPADLKVDDYAFVAISGRTTKFVSILGNGDVKGGSFKYRLNAGDIGEDGNVRVSIGVVDVHDKVYNTTLRVTSFGSLYAGDLGTVGDTTDAADLGMPVKPPKKGEDEIAQGLPYTDSDDAFDDPYYQGPPPDLDDDSDFDPDDFEYASADWPKGDPSKSPPPIYKPGGGGWPTVPGVPQPFQGQPGTKYPLAKKKPKSKTVVAHHEPQGEVLSEKKKLKSVKDFSNYPGKPSPMGWPEEEPPKTINGYHPDLVDGKEVSNRYNRLDAVSAKAMPPTGNPHIDKKVRAAAARIKEEAKITNKMSAFKKPTDIAPEHPKEVPPQMDPETGMHPKYGKKYKHDKLDPHSAEFMPPTGDPVIDANIKKATNAKEKARKLKILMGKTKRG